VGDYVRLPKDIVIEYKDEHYIDCLIDFVFPNPNKNTYCTQYMCERGIHCMRNDYVDEINAKSLIYFQAKLRCSIVLIRWMIINVTIILKTFSIQ
jgi:hypothetical protein